MQTMGMPPQAITAQIFNPPFNIPVVPVLPAAGRKCGDLVAMSTAGGFSFYVWDCIIGQWISLVYQGNNTPVLTLLPAAPPNGANTVIIVAGGIFYYFVFNPVLAAWERLDAKVPLTRTIATTAPLTGGGDLSADRTLAIPKATAAVDGYLSAVDWAIFNAKVPLTRTIATTAPLTGGGNLSADRTLSFDLAYIREKLTGARTYYVRIDGNDANTGLVDSAAGAFLTIQRAVVVYQGLDCNDNDVTIQIRDGTYAAGASITCRVGRGSLNLIGNTGAPANCIIDTPGSCIYISGHPPGNNVAISGFRLKSATAHGIICLNFSRCSFVSVDFGAIALHQAYATAFGLINVTGNYSISGGAASHMMAERYSLIQNDSIKTVTIAGAPAFSSRFAYAVNGHIVTSGNVTWNGAATGQRYYAEKNGIVDTSGQAANWLPGNAAGAIATQGQYL